MSYGGGMTLYGLGIRPISLIQLARNRDRELANH